MTNTEGAEPMYMLKISSVDIDVVDRAEGPYTDAEAMWRRDILMDRPEVQGVEYVRYTTDLPVHKPEGWSNRAMLPIFLFLIDGSVRVIEFDCNEESAFQALERVYRTPYPHDFDLSDIKFIRFGPARLS